MNFERQQKVPWNDPLDDKSRLEGAQRCAFLCERYRSLRLCDFGKIASHRGTVTIAVADLHLGIYEGARRITRDYEGAGRRTVLRTERSVADEIGRATVITVEEAMRWLWVIVLVALALPAAAPRKTYRSKPTPRLYGDRVPVRLIRTSNSKVRQKIVDTHNYFRTQVKPPAANMLIMKWHPGLARAAQRWANRCMGLVHDNATGLYLDGFGQSGQNIFITTGRTLWNFPIRMWYMEYKDFEYGPNAVNEILEIGHYTQVVWATTHLIGCGLSHCTGRKGPLGKDFYMYVCNYAPSGNFNGRLGLPYVTGPPCSMCKEHCTREKLCTNACYHVDLWSNCAALVKTFRSWVCETNTREGRERRKFCGATCNCSDKIYFRHDQ